MKKGLILNNAYSQLKSSINQSLRLKDEFKAIGVETDIKPNNYFPAYIDSDGNIKSIAKDYDFCVYLDKDKYISQMLEKSGLRLFNRHKAICDCDDKMITAIELANIGIKMPLTFSGLLCYDDNAEIQEDEIKFLENKIGYPIIIKSSYGSLGKGVYKADSRDELYKILSELKCVPHLFQQFISESSGMDIRVIVIGGECVAAMKRTAKNDFRSNIELGGIGKKINLPTEIKNLCKKTAKKLNLDYCGIDILIGRNDYLICEVNSNAFFGGIEGVTGINIAKAYADYIFKIIY